MADANADRQAILDTVWAHAFEEDAAAAGGAVYRPAAGVARSRRPRERLKLNADGTATLWLPGPDDRLQQQPATWTEEEGVWVIRSGASVEERRIVERTSDRLVVSGCR